MGVAAALTTKSKQVGFVGGVHNDLIKAFEAGYTAGVKAVDPSIKVDIAYIQESNLSGFNDPAGGKTAAAGEFDQGADVVYHASGASGSGVFDAAVEAGDGNWAIGVDSDQYLTATAAQKPHILTSALKRVDVASFEWLKTVNAGDPGTGYVTYDLTNNGVGYSTSGGFLDSINEPDPGLRRQDQERSDQGPDRSVIRTGVLVRDAPGLRSPPSPPSSGPGVTCSRAGRMTGPRPLTGGLRGSPRTRSSPITTSTPPRSSCPASASASRASSPTTTSTLTIRPAPSTPSSGRTAPASRR